MSDQEEETEKPFAVERAKTGRAKCKKCKCPIDKDVIRIAKLMSNPFGDGKMKAWHHLTCIFDVFAKQRATTKRIENPSEDVSGWDDLDDDGRKSVIEKLEEFENNAPFKTATKKQTMKKAVRAQSPSNLGPPTKVAKLSPKDSLPSTSKKNLSNDKKLDVKKAIDSSANDKTTRDHAFREFRRLCADLSNASAYTEKTAIVKRRLTMGANTDGFQGDLFLWCKLLLPGAVKRIYNLQSKQLVKLFARLFRQNEDEMLENLEQGDVAETIKIFFEKSTAVTPSSQSLLTLQEVDEFLEELTQLTKEDDQAQHFRSLISRCTPNDLKMIIRLIKRDLRINAGPKHILEAVHPDAYKAYQVSNDLGAVIERCVNVDSSTGASTSIKDSPKNAGKNATISLSLMTPVLPMLAEPCKSVDMAMKKCPNGMLSEVKYDGERVQVHKKGTEFRYFSRSLKPVLPHKIKLFKDYIPEAFPDGDDLILDSEILMIDTNTGQPLPFGSLGKHKKEEFKDANVCLFVFDCLYYNGDVLMNKPMKERRRILKNTMTIIPNRIMLSEVQEVHDPKDLAQMIAQVLKMGLEGLVLKDINSLYEPGMRHWLKVKKDYLFDGAMADSADLVVLGAWYGTGNKGGMMSVFLMGCYDDDTKQWVTVTKVHGGHDDATLARLQDELDMIKIGKDHNLVPNWLRVNRPMVPDFIARDPQKSPVWEITGAEFTNQGVHTADSISIRFPRVTKIRDDKCWRTATSLKELRVLFDKSASSIDFSLLLGDAQDKQDKKPSSLDTFLQPSTSGIPRSPSPSPLKKIKDESPSDDEDDFNGRPRRKAVGLFSSVHYDESSDSDPSEDESVPQSDGIFSDVRISLSRDLGEFKRKALRQTLKANGARILRRQALSEATHVIHNSNAVSATVLLDRSGVPKTARHVNYSWVERSAAESKMLDVSPHAVKLLGDYCECPCSHGPRGVQ
ncbi:DNA ligase 3 [Venturia canescens]|uniref:DNA ligase 3 n=1 Tax=Venturia canescens TaxID=32260 RepID=UPI001C9C3F58|nr:DNA ligase 3 [Venturia canescens]